MKYEISDAVPILEGLLGEGRLNIFIGSGISIDSGIPSWNGLIDEFLNMAKNIRFVDPIDKAKVEQIYIDAAQRQHDGRFSPIEIATVLKSTLKNAKEISIPQSQAYMEYKNWIGKIFGSKTPNQKHKDIVSTDYKYILTSNYDDLLQAAAYDMNYLELSSQTFDYGSQTEIIRKVNNAESAIIHVHGMVNKLNIDDLIFTKEDYNRMILKQFPGFSFALRMLFTRYSTLFVGYGASDPHLEEVLEELSEYFPLVDSSFALPENFLVTLRSKVDTIFERYKERIGTSLIIIDDFQDYNNLLTHLKNFKQRV